MTKAPHPLLIVPAFLLGIIVFPWLVFVMTSLIGPAFVFGGVLLVGWCLGRRVKPADASRYTPLQMREKQMRERLEAIVHNHE